MQHELPLQSASSVHWSVRSLPAQSLFVMPHESDVPIVSKQHTSPSLHV